ncbi:MAG: RNA-guided endonuclease InsQ/TnpB family protein [Candidatus Dormibacteria bacterium]
MKQTLPVKLAPTGEQSAALLATMERFNAACDAIAEVAFRERCANKIELQKLVYYTTRERFGLSSQLTVRAISKVVEAYKRDKTIQPKFRPHGAVPYDQRIMSWKGVEAVSLLTLTGRVIVPTRLGAYQSARIDRRQGQADLIYRGGTWFLYVTVETPEPTPMQPEDYIGVDLGIVNIAADSDGATYTGAAIETKRRIYSHRRRNLQRNSSKSAKRKLRSIKGRQARYQRDVNHCISKTVVRHAKDTGRGIAVEDLTGIRDRVTVRRRQRARHSNWGFHQLRAFLTYKATLSGVVLVAVDPRNTSRTCPECGSCDKRNRPTRDVFRCRTCGHAASADTNAARNVRARAVVMRPKVSAA